MTIIRRTKEKWTVVDNRIITDKSLTLESLGLLVHMLSKPNDWVFSQEQLGGEFGKGREAMRSLMKTLTQAGYVQRELVRDEKGHIRTITIVSEKPIRQTGQPEAGEPEAANPSVGQPAPLVITDLNKRLNKVNTKEVTRKRDDLFDLFWQAYPKRVGKDAARKAFEKRKPNEELVQAMVKAIGQQQKTDSWIKGFVPNPATWLNDGRWQDEVEVRLFNEAPSFLSGAI